MMMDDFYNTERGEGGHGHIHMTGFDFVTHQPGFECIFFYKTAESCNGHMIRDQTTKIAYFFTPIFFFRKTSHFVVGAILYCTIYLSFFVVEKIYSLRR